MVLMNSIKAVPGRVKTSSNSDSFRMVGGSAVEHALAGVDESGGMG